MIGAGRADGRAAPHVVIVGGGFAGLAAARALRSAPVRVTLVDRRNHHLFQPLLYQVASALLDPSDIAVPLRSVVRRHRNTVVLLAEVTGVDPAARRVHLTRGTLEYDHLILSTGATHSYFGHDEWGRHAPGLKTLEDALEIRRRVLIAFERAESEADAVRRRAWLTFIVVGGGPTGVELAGALAEISRGSLVGELRVADPRAARVVLVEALPRVLPTYSPELSVKALRQLRALGVEVVLGRRVTAMDDRGVDLEGERIDARTILWGAGVAASPVARSLGAPLDRAGRVEVLSDLTIPGHPEIAVVGDLAAVKNGDGWVPGVAPAAMQEGRHVAENVLRRLEGSPPLPFRYFDKGSFATIGRGAAVGEIGERVRVSGAAAWLAWLFIHILFLVGFRNRALVLFSWAYSYATGRRGARLIVGEPPPDPDEPIGPAWERQAAAGVEGIMTRSRGRSRSGKVAFAALLFGVALGGAVDDILFHRLLGWHHVSSDVVEAPGTASALRHELRADGVFAAAMWGVALLALALLWRAYARGEASGSTGRFAAQLLAGFGLFHVVEGVLFHLVLGLHHARPGPGQLAWDLGLVALGALLALLGWVLQIRPRKAAAGRRVTSSPRTPVTP